jgi:hypothetical protein
MIEETALEVALKLLRKFWYAIPMLGLAIALMLSNHNLSNAREALKGEADFRTTLQLRIGAKANDHATLYATADGMMRTNANLAGTLLTISQQAEAAHKQSVAADAALSQLQAKNEKLFAAAQSEIQRLEHQKSTGDCAADLLQISKDTQAPWKDWK